MRADTKVCRWECEVSETRLSINQDRELLTITKKKDTESHCLRVIKGMKWHRIKFKNVVTYFCNQEYLSLSFLKHST